MIRRKDAPETHGDGSLGSIKDLPTKRRAEAYICSNTLILFLKNRIVAGIQDECQKVFIL